MQAPPSESTNTQATDETTIPAICIQLHAQCPSRTIYQIKSIYQSYESTIQMAMQLLRTEPVLNKLTTTDNPWPNRTYYSLGRHTTVVNMDSHYEEYNGNQVASKLTNTEQTQTTRNPSTHHLNCKHHTICHPGKQTEAKWGNEYPPEG